MTQPVYRIIAVDGTDEDTQDTLRDLHKVVFADTAPVPEFEGYWWIVYHGAEAVGFAHLRHSYAWTGTGYLSRAGIIEGHRGHGLQRKLIRVRERKARSIGWTTLLSDTTNSTASANNLIACGYRLYEPSEPYAFSTTNYWRKKL